jgi:uncharacterized caspase-like protein
MVRTVVALLFLAIWLAPSAAGAEQRIALVVTNQAYTQAGAGLTNTHRDGDLVKAALEKVGFKVWVVRDTANERALLQAIAQHIQRLADAGPGAVGFFYYSGHGAADRPNGENFLIPTDVPLTHASQLTLLAVPLDKITATLAGAGRMSFVVFDACRNVPLQRESKDIAFKGFAPVREQNGLLVAFATEPGNVAVDQSLYAKALAEEIVKPGLEAAQVFRRVRLRVREDTKRVQSPEYLDKRDFDFHFAAVAPSPQPVPVAPSPATQPQVAVATPPPSAMPAKPGQPAAAVTPTPAEQAQAALEQARAEAAAYQSLKCDRIRELWVRGMASAESLFQEKCHFEDCPNCPEMAVVPAGRFTMGSPADEPQRKDDENQLSVTIARPFAVGRFAVTRGEFAAFVSATGHKTEGGCTVSTGSGWKQQSDNTAHPMK